MSKTNGITSLRDAFLALDDILDEEINVEKKGTKSLTEGASVDIKDPTEIDLAADFRNNDKKKEDVELEVIDVDANKVDNLKDNGSYVGKQLLQCNSCKSPIFIDVEKLVPSEDESVYNVGEECPHCHNTNGYTLLGEVAKKAAETSEEPAFDNDATGDDSALFDNTKEVAAQDAADTNNDSENSEEKGSDAEYNETTAEDDTNDLDLPQLGDEFDIDDVELDDTEEQDEEDKTKKESLEEEIEPTEDFSEEIDEEVNEDLDMATFEGSIANLVDTFFIEDNPVNIKLLNKNGSELGIYSSNDLPFKVKSQMMDTFNTDDNYLEFSVSKYGDGTKVSELFNFYRPDENNETVFIVTNEDTGEEIENSELSEILQSFGDYYIDGTLGLRTLNIYVQDSDLDTEVEPLDDEELIELGKENAEKEVTEESLIENIINYYPNLKLNRINNPFAEEYFISQSINLNEDLDLVYNKYIKNTNKAIIEQFKSYTGYEDEVDKFLKEHNISREQYIKILNESANKIYSIGDKSYVLSKDSYGNYKLDDKESKDRVADWDSYDDAISDINKWIKAGKIIDPTDTTEELEERLLTSVKNRADLSKAINKLSESNEKYHIKKSVTEGYRYDIFVDSKSALNETLFDNILAPAVQEPEVNYDIQDKIDRIANDICTAINQCYGVDVSGKKDLIIADIMDDLQLLDGQDIESYLDSEQFTSENILAKVGTEDFIAAVKAGAVPYLDTAEVAPLEIEAKAEIEAPVDENLNEGADGNTILSTTIKYFKQGLSDEEIIEKVSKELDVKEDSVAWALRDLHASEEQQNNEDLNEDADPLLVDQDGDIEDPNFNLDSLASESLTEDTQPEDDDIYNTEKRLAELTYLKKQRPLSDDELEELAYCQNEVTSRWAEQAFLNGIKEDAENDKLKSDIINIDEFDDCINEFLSEDDEDNFAYRSLTIESLEDNSIQIKGIMEGLAGDKEITFTLKENLSEDVNEGKKFTVTNNLNESKFLLEL